VTLSAARAPSSSALKDTPAARAPTPVKLAALPSAPAKRPPLDALVDRRLRQGALAVDAETTCLARAVQHEAGAEPLVGKLAVAQLIIHRVKSPLFPKTICGVINQPGQFIQIAAQTVAVGSHWRDSVAIARIARAAAAPEVAPGALFFHADYVSPSWSHRRIRVARVGAQTFYR
jgi:spore germination cell wall hydrolase CwlJ-like protein